MKILAIGDTHFPWADKKVLEKIYAYASDHAPWDLIIQCGDLLDWYSSSRFARSHNVIKPAEEVDWGRLEACKFWTMFDKIDRKAKKIQLMGNHCDRPLKRIQELAPSLEHLLVKGIKDLYTFDNVRTIHSSRQEFVYKGIMFQHGYRHKLGDHVRYNLKSTVVGHTHKGGVITFPVNQKSLFELNVGFVADVNAVPMKYSASTITRWTHGFGVIDEHGPRFIAL